VLVWDTNREDNQIRVGSPWPNDAAVRSFAAEAVRRGKAVLGKRREARPIRTGSWEIRSTPRSAEEGSA
jgi:hypothetical protein